MQILILEITLLQKALKIYIRAYPEKWDANI